jgi:D-glycero-D-manno-heptose 1,7-bisphosphate phosphatase
LTHPGVAFLDRDGTINVKAREGEYITRQRELTLLPGAARAVRHLNDANCHVIVVTNQRGIALRRMTEADLAAVHARLATMLDEEAGARIDAFFHCPHGRDECTCRKPLPGMFFAAQHAFPWIDLGASIMIGDSESDVAAAGAAGVRSLRLGADAEDLASAVDAVLSGSSRTRGQHCGPTSDDGVLSEDHADLV